MKVKWSRALPATPTSVTVVKDAAGGIETVSVVHGPWEVRVHRVDGPGGGVVVREGGWAVADDAGQPEVRTGPGRALARRTDGLTSAIVGLYGWSGTEGVVVRAVDTNAVGRHSATPVLELAEGAGLLVTLVVLTADPAVPLTGASATVAADGAVEIRFPDGTPERVPPLSAPRPSSPAPAPGGRS
ncbi:hypothetical protein SAMN04487981_107405 [Streptomyces sp. cf386]|nr:hypothetical protein SAMN04487981_107405 [Streptomyces sp. cf386]